MPTWNLEIDNKTYPFSPEKDFTIADWEKMEEAFGEELGGWFSFRNLLWKGNHRVARCLIWGAKRKAGERVDDDPRRVELPKGFEMGVFFENVTNQDAIAAQAEAAKNPVPLDSTDTPPSDGTDPSVE